MFLHDVNDTQKMTATIHTFCDLGLLLFFLIAIGGIGRAQQTTTSINGTWSGIFISTSPDISPFTMTVKVNSDSRGHLIGDVVSCRIASTDTTSK